MGNANSGRPRGTPNPYREPKRKLHPLVYALRKLRVTAGITQGDMAQKSGYSHRTIEDWERGNNLPHILALQTWAEAAGLRLALLDKDGNEVT